MFGLMLVVLTTSPWVGDPSNTLLRRTHIPAHTMARTTMIMKNTAAMATTTYSQTEEGSWLVGREVATVGSVGEGALDERLVGREVATVGSVDDGALDERLVGEWVGEEEEEEG
jgi:hypothetical protein